MPNICRMLRYVSFDTNIQVLKLFCSFFIERIKRKKKKMESLSRVWLFATPWTVAYQAPPSMGFSRQEYLSGVPFPSPGDLPDPGIKPRFHKLWADTLPSEPPGKPQRIKSAVLLLAPETQLNTWRKNNFSLIHF